MIHATCIGNLGGDAELRVTGSGKEVTGFSLATKGRDRDAAPTWVRCSMWGERGKKVKPYLVKGGRVAVSGTLTTKEHNGKTYVELDVQELELLGDKQASGGEVARKVSTQPAPAEVDDDIPF